MFRRNCLLKHAIEEKTEPKRIRGIRLKQLSGDVKESIEFERGSTRSACLANCLWKMILIIIIIII